MRVGIIGLLHESNTFVSQKTTIKHFEQDVLAIGNQVTDIFAGHQHEISGFIEELASKKVTAVPLFAARAYPSGIIEGPSFDRLCSLMLDQLESVKSLDGILVAPHGATVAENALDADGYWLSKIRERVGDSVPLIGTLDPHANLTSLMVESSDALIAYRTNPHVDQREKGIEAAQLMLRTLEGETMPVQQAAFPSLAINIERQMTGELPLKKIYDAANVQLKHEDVLSNSLLLGFPYADVEEMGAAVLVVTDNDTELAQTNAVELGRLLWANRVELDGNLNSIAAAIQKSLSLEKPVCLLDMGDNIGGGSPGDSTFLLHGLRDFDFAKPAKALACICDVEVVKKLCHRSLGETFELSVGAKSDRLRGDPMHNGPMHGVSWHGVSFCDRFEFVGRHQGTFKESAVTHGGFSHYDQGESVVLRTLTGDLTLLVTSKRVPPFSVNQLLSCGLDPAQFDYVVAKGVNAPIQSYSRCCKNFIKVDTPGCTSANMHRLDYRRRRKPLFPFEILDSVNNGKT